MSVAIASNSTGLELVISNILARHPVQLSITEAGKIIGFLTRSAVLTARARGTYPLRVRERGEKLVVFTSDLIDYLVTGESQSSLSVPLRKRARKPSKTTGRPTKPETLEAQRLGLSVRELRAQHALELVGSTK